MSDQFWAMLQSGLMSVDSLTRKRAMYLVKRSVDTLTSDMCRVTDNTGLICDKENKNTARDTFDDYFLILETLEEKQVHLVKQVISKIEQILAKADNSKTKMHHSWILIMFLRLFQHPNTSIVRWGVQTFLLSKFSSQTVSDQHFLSFLCNPLLDVLNDTKLYSKEDGDSSTGSIIADLVTNFVNNCLSALDKSQQSHLIRTFVVAISNKSWAPVPLTWMSFSLVKINIPEKYLSRNEMNYVLNLVETQMQYQDPLLRAAAQV